LKRSAERLDAVGDGIRDSLFRNNADDFGRAPPAAAFDHYCHGGVAPPHALNDVEHDVGLARDGEIALRDARVVIDRK
jgi:hypothetical protein